MGVKVEQLNPETMQVVTHDYPEATTAEVDDDSKALTVIIEAVYVEGKAYADDIAVGGYPEGSYNRWYITNIPKYSTTPIPQPATHDVAGVAIRYVSE